MINGKKTERILMTENSSFILPVGGKDLNYFQKKFAKALHFEKNENYEIASCQNVIGVVKTPGCKDYRFYSKFADNLKIFRMIEKISRTNYVFKKESTYIYFDPGVIVNVAEGESLSLKLIDIFLWELNRVKNTGFSKQYRLREENIRFLRGRLLIERQIKFNLVPKSFFSRYSDLNYGTPENLILYSVISKLINWSTIKREQRNKLLFFNKLFISMLEDLGNTQFKGLKYVKNRLNNQYSMVMNICQMLLNKSFYSSLVNGDNLFCNFLVRTDVLFERYIFLHVQEVIEQEFDGLVLDEQVHIKSVRQISEGVDVGSLDQYGDIVIYLDLDVPTPVLVIDTKYIKLVERKKYKNSAYFQIMSYMNGLYVDYGRSSIVDGLILGCGMEGKTYKTTFEEGKEFYIFSEGIDISGSEDAIRNELKEILSRILPNYVRTKQEA